MMKTIKELKKTFLSQYAMSSVATKSKYDRELDLFFSVCDINNINDIESFNEQNIQKFYDYCNLKKWSASTINQRLAVAKLFTSWALKKQIISKDFLADVKKMRTSSTVHYTPSSIECEKFLSYIQEHTDKKRLYLMVKLLLNAGFRRAEICNLKINDINRENSSIKVVGKGNKIVEQPISEGIILELIDYINTERQEVMNKYQEIGGKDKGYIFVSGIGENVNKDKKNLNNGNQINDNVFYQQIKRYAKLAGIKNAEQFSPHCIRRNFVTSIYEKTGDIMIAQKAARHSNIETTTKCYINFDQDRVRNAVNILYESNIQTKKSDNDESHLDNEYELFLALKRKFENV